MSEVKFVQPFRYGTLIPRFSMLPFSNFGITSLLQHQKYLVAYPTSLVDVANAANAAAAAANASR